jgi:hypothetical protein
MEINLSSNVMEPLEKLAEQMGLHAKELWPYLVKQVYLEAVISSFVTGWIAFIAMTLIYKYGNMSFGLWNKKDNNGKIVSDNSQVITVISLFVIFICAMIFFFFSIPHFYNAEYFAFKDLMQMLGHLSRG